MKKQAYTKHQIILNIALTAVFSGLIFAVMYIKIPLPSPTGTPILHLGNLVVVLVSLLFGGMTGGISGAVGMGLFDIFYYPSPLSVIRTFVLKSGIGLITGYSYLHLKKKSEKRILSLFYVLGGCFFLCGIISFILSFYYQDRIFTINDKSADPSVALFVLYLFLIIMGLILLLLPSLIHKKAIKSADYKAAILSASIAMAFNIIGEFAYQIIKQMLFGNKQACLPFAIAALPATVINAMTVILAVCFFHPALKKAFDKLFMKEDFRGIKS